MSDNRKKLSSPTCAADEADDAYMGFAGKEEIAAFLAELADENSRAKALARLRKFLPKVRGDMLHAELAATLKAYESREG